MNCDKSFSRPPRAATRGVSSSFAPLVAARYSGPARRPTLAVVASVSPPASRSYLRALRAAEMVAWEASGGDAWISNTNPGRVPDSNHPAAEHAVTKALPPHSPLGVPPLPRGRFGDSRGDLKIF